MSGGALDAFHNEVERHVKSAGTQEHTGLGRNLTKLMAARIVVVVPLLGLAAWPQDHPKAEISIDYS
jgi:hypothetical protein